MAIMDRKTAAKLKTYGKSLGLKIKLMFWDQDLISVKYKIDVSPTSGST